MRLVALYLNVVTDPTDNQFPPPPIRPCAVITPHGTQYKSGVQSALVAMFACSRRKGVLCTGLALVIVLYHLTTQPTPHKVC